MDGDQGVAECPGRDATLEQLGHPGDVAGRFGHLAAVHLQVGAVKPGLDERLPRGGLALRDLVLVMGKDQVDAARMDVERRPEVGHAHGGAFDMPARPSLAD